MLELPSKDNLYVIIYSSITKQDLAQLFAKNGWETRKSSLSDFEAECDWAELVFEGEDEVLINGVIAENRFHTLLVLLDNLEYLAELYNADSKLIESKLAKKK